MWTRLFQFERVFTTSNDLWWLIVAQTSKRDRYSSNWVLECREKIVGSRKICHFIWFELCQFSWKREEKRTVLNLRDKKTSFVEFFDNWKKIVHSRKICHLVKRFFVKQSHLQKNDRQKNQHDNCYWARTEFIVRKKTHF